MLLAAGGSLGRRSRPRARAKEQAGGEGQGAGAESREGSVLVLEAECEFLVPSSALNSVSHGHNISSAP